MATQPGNDTSSDDPTGNLFDNELAQSMKASAQQLWQAGLGAFSKAQEEGGKLLEQRVAQVLQRMGVPTQAEVAELHEQIASLSEELASLRQQLVSTPARGVAARKARAARKAAATKEESGLPRKRSAVKKAPTERDAAASEPVTPDLSR